MSKRLQYFRILSSLLLAMALGATQAAAQVQPPAGTPDQPEQNPSTLNRTLNAQPQQPANQAPAIGQAPRELPPDSIRPNYVLGPNDQILIRTQAEEINEKPFRIDADGNINLPLLGRVHAAGLTLQELENDLTTRLREYIREPQVIIQVTQFRSAPIFFVGAFKAPGIYPLQGTRTLMEMLTQIGGLQPNASQRITITRRAEYGPIPLPNAVEDPERKISTVEISLASLRQNVNPAEDIILQPYDQISVERAEQIYVTGEVMRTGGVDLGERESISLAQVLTMAGGLSREAMPSKVRILRPIVGTTRRAAIEVNVKRIFEGKNNDVPLLPNDILYIPRSYTNLFLRTTGQLALSLMPYMIFLAVQ